MNLEEQMLKLIKDTQQDLNDINRKISELERKQTALIDFNKAAENLLRLINI